MNIDPLDRDNMIRMVVAGRLESLRRYAKSVLNLVGARQQMDADGRPVMASLPSFSGPRRLPEIKVLDSTAINSARDLVQAFRTCAGMARDVLDPDIIEWFDTYIGEAPATVTDPWHTVAGGWTAPATIIDDAFKDAFKPGSPS